MVLLELNHYLENRTISNKLIDELKLYLGTLYYNFKNFNPRFVIFYDTGVTQNTVCDSNYKANRTKCQQILYY